MTESRFKQIAKLSLVLSLVIIIVFLSTNMIGLAKGGFESSEILSLQTFYLIGGIFAFGLFLLAIYSIFIQKGDEKYGNSIGFVSLGRKPHVSFFKRFTHFQIFLLSLILFLILGLLNFALIDKIPFLQKSYTGVGFLESQQFTPTDSIIYSTLLIPGAENLGGALLFALVLVVLGIIARKRKMDFRDYKTLAIFVPAFLLGGFGVANHLLRYFGQEVSLIIVFMFWTIGGFLTALTGSFIPFFVLHLVNNFYFDISRFLSSDTVFLLIIIFIILLSFLYIIIYKDRPFGRKKKEDG